MSDSKPSLLLADQRRRWEGGDQVRVEHYLKRDPSLRDSGDVLLDLIYHEIILREASGESPTLSEYQTRFPHLSDSLRDQFEVHTALAGTSRARRRASDRVPSIPGLTGLKKLGSGGMGVVYKARQERLGRVVAVKVIRDWTTADPDELVRFRKEAEAVARIIHPNVVGIHGIGDRAGCPYLILEFVDGGSLDQQLRGQPQTSKAAAKLVAILARAADYLHRRGIVHCDLKPANVLLARAEPPAGVELGTPPHRGRFVPKIADFGFARRLDATAASRSGRALGTPQYMAPEQVSGPNRRIGPAADIHALGAILYELLVGRPPYLGANLLDVMRQVQLFDPVSPRRLVPTVPRDLETVCLKCLHKDPTHRYTSAAELAEDLERFRSGWPVLARPVGPASHAWLWCRRNPVVAGLAAALIVAVIVGFSSVTVGLIVAQRERNDKETARRGEKARADELADTLHDLEAITHRTRIAAADRERHSNNIDGANRLLDECRVDLRGFEWHLLKRLCAGSRRTVKTDYDFATLVSISADQRLIAVLGGTKGPLGSYDPKKPQTISLINAETGAVLRTLPENGKASPDVLAFCPDGRRLAVAMSDNTVEMWNTETGQSIWSIKTNRHVYDLSFRSDTELQTASGDLIGQLPAVGGNTDTEFRIWDVNTGRIVETVVGTSQKNSDRGRLSPDGKRFVCWSRDHDGSNPPILPVLVYDTATGKPVGSHSDHKSPIQTAAWTPDGSAFAIGEGKAVRVYGTADGKLLGTLTETNGIVDAIDLAQGGRLVAMAERDGSIQVWDIQTGQVEVYRGHTNTVADVLFLAGAQALLSAGEDGTIRWWDMNRTGTAVRFSTPSGVTSVAAASGDFFAAAAVPDEGTIRLIDRTGQLNRVILGKPDLAVRPDGAVLAGGSVEENELPKDTVYGTRLWETATGQAKSFLPWALPPRSFTPDGRSLIAVRGRSVTKRGLPVTEDVSVQGVVQKVTKEGPLVTVIEREGVLVVYDAESGSERFSLSGHTRDVHAMCVGDGGKSLATADPTEVIVWNLETRGIRSRFPVTPQVRAMAYRPDGTQLVTAGLSGKTIAVRDPVTGQARYTLKLNVHVMALAFSPDSRLLAAGCQDGSVRIWEAATGDLLLTLTELHLPVWSLAFGGGGQWLVAGSGNFSDKPGGEVVVWDSWPKPQTRP
jgi:serine/threonine protein kinase/WD40 repeat protein